MVSPKPSRRLEKLARWSCALGGLAGLPQALHDLAHRESLNVEIVAVIGSVQQRNAGARVSLGAKVTPLEPRRAAAPQAQGDRPH